MSNHLPLASLALADLSSVTGGAGESWGQATKNAAGGFAAGLLHGATGKVDQVERFADPSSRATKGGFETGAAINMATGKLGDAVSAAADWALPSQYNK